MGEHPTDSRRSRLLQRLAERERGASTEPPTGVPPANAGAAGVAAVSPTQVTATTPANPPSTGAGTYLPAAPPQPPSDTGEVGVVGTTNYVGILQVEQNQRLAHQKAFGMAGSLEWGEWERLHRTDHAVASALNLLVAPLRDAVVEVDPGHDEPDEDDFGGPSDGDADNTEPIDHEAEAELQKRIASFVRDNLREWLAPGWNPVLEQIVVYGVGYGFSLHEYVWGARDDARVPGGKALYIKRLAQRLPSSIRIDGWIERDGDLAVIRQMGLRDGHWTYAELPADKVLLCTWNRNGNNYQGFSAFRPVWYLANMRAELLRILGIGSAREALGVPTISAIESNAPALSKEQADAVQTFLENCHFHENLSLMVPRGYKLEWIYSGGADKGSVLALWQALGLAIYETVQQQQTQLGTNGTGSRAVGEVHDASKNAFISGVRAWVENCLNGIGDHTYTGLVKKLVDVNFGPQKKYPKVRLVTPATESDEKNLRRWQFAMAVSQAVQAGALNLTPKDEDTVRELFGLPELSDADRAEIVARKEAADAAAEAMKAPDAGTSDAGMPEENGGSKADPGGPSRFNEGIAGAGVPKVVDPFPSTGGWTPRRLLTDAEKTVDLADVAGWFESGRDRFEALTKPIVREMIRAVLPDLRDAMADGDPSEVAYLNLDTSALRAAIESFIASAVQYGYRVTRSAARKVKGEVALGEYALADGKRPKLVEAQTKLVTDRVAARVKQALQDKAVDVARSGGKADLLADLVLEGLQQSKALRADAGVVLSRSFSIGAEEAARDEGFEWVEYSAILDGNTCGACDAADGKRFKVGSPEYYDFLPPFAGCAGKANCRCIFIPVNGPR